MQKFPLFPRQIQARIAEALTDTPVAHDRHLPPEFDS